MNKPTLLEVIVVDDLYQFYKNELTFKSAVIRYVSPIWKWLFSFSIIFFILLIITYLITQNTLLGIASIAFLILVALVTRIKYSLLIKQKYPELWVSWGNWSKPGFHKMYLDRLEIYLDSIENSKLDELQKVIKERANQSRIPLIISFSTFGALFIPLWNSYISTIFSSFKNNKIEDIGIVFSIFLFLILSISIISPIISEIRDNILTQYVKLNRLNDLISEVRLSRRK